MGGWEAPVEKGHTDWGGSLVGLSMGGFVAVGWGWPQW